MKFTEEQYQKIVEIGGGFEEPFLENLSEYVSGQGILDDEDLYLSKAVAIANPLTREWAHDRFVEKEKKYYWTSKKSSENEINKKIRLYKPLFTDFVTSYVRNVIADGNHEKDEQLTVSEIREWGYNPEMFDREEIK